MKTSCIITIIIGVAYYVAAYFFCHIDPEKTYTWYSGIWHGIFWFPNIVMSLFSDSIYAKAPNCTTGYTVFYFLSIIVSSVIGNIIRGASETIVEKKS
jgi:hypothetical protein